MIGAEGENRTLVSRTTTAHSTIELQPPLFNLSLKERIKTLLETSLKSRKEEPKEAQLEKYSVKHVPITSAFTSGCHDKIREREVFKVLV